MNWYLKVLNQYADFNGRARRMEYWVFSLINSLIMMIPIAIGFMITLIISNDYYYNQSPIIIGVIVAVLYALATFIPSLAVTVRRLHDSDKSGFAYLFVLIPFVGGLILFILLLLDGSPGSNKYGQNPKSNKYAGGSSGSSSW